MGVSVGAVRCMCARLLGLFLGSVKQPRWIFPLLLECLRAEREPVKLGVLSRTIIIGDVHGCRLELESLLDRVAFASGDRLVFVGDLVARGPDSLGVLDIARRTGAIVVRGNHEQKLLDWRRSRTAWMRGEAAAKAPIGRMHRDLARALRPVDWTLLETSPLFLALPEHGACVVHAGIVPGIAIEEQAPQSLMRIRTVRVPIKKG